MHVMHGIGSCIVCMIWTIPPADVRPSNTKHKPDLTYGFPEYTIRGPEPDSPPAMVRQRFLDSVPIQDARTTAQISAAMAFRPKIGRPIEGPGIIGRKKRS